MEQAHTRLIHQLVERMAAEDNAPLYIRFADTIKDAVRSGWLENGNILPGERDFEPAHRRVAHHRAQGAADAGR
ncbi:Uncharacterized HTH-type transcriptional regulator yegW [Raoultella terrigena]|uniref:Uncharacterized HTH-type transcriptional regulator yegW n=1 Tax=Raoultella terrigena TaxID=577 RepID=A0A485C3X4_RAOTE|nr:Uncharacterized HTH-type transcriptional regulator yegW [Raoultella terrigena]